MGELERLPIYNDELYFAGFVEGVQTQSDPVPILVDVDVVSRKLVSVIELAMELFLLQEYSGKVPSPGFEEEVVVGEVDEGTHDAKITTNFLPDLVVDRNEDQLDV